MVNKTWDDISWFLACAGALVVWISDLKMRSYLGGCQGQDWWQWIPGSDLGVIMDYVSLTKKNTGKIGIWFKWFLTGILVMFFAILFSIFAA